MNIEPQGPSPVGEVVGVCKSPSHTFSKSTESKVRLIEGLGVEGDAHMGATVKHRSRVARDPLQPNLRQVHLIHSELHDELREQGFDINPGEIGENITTRGIGLLSLPVGTQLQIGANAVVEITGLRNPCGQLDNFQKGLTAALLDRDSEGNLMRKAGVMGIVLHGGDVSNGDAIVVALPPGPHTPLGVV